MMRCPRCPNGAVIASNADPVSTVGGSRPLPNTTSNNNNNHQDPNSRPTTGPYVDLTLTMQQMPAELKCRSCGWKRDADGMSVSTTSESPFADSSTAFDLLSISDIPLHPGLEASGRNDDLIQRLMRFPRGVLCTSCGGPSDRLDEATVKSCLNSFKNLPHPPNDIESRASWWAFQSTNFSGRPVILEWYYVVTRAIESNKATDDMADVCIGCGRVCVAKYAPTREIDMTKANPTAPLAADWAEKQRERERESRRRNPLRRRAERGEDGLPVPGTGGIIYSDEEQQNGDDDGSTVVRQLVDRNGEDDADEMDQDDNNNNAGDDGNNQDNARDNREIEEQRIDLNNTRMNNRNNNILNSGAPFPQPHDHTTGAARRNNNNNRRSNNNNNNNGEENNNNNEDSAINPVAPVEVIADPQAVKDATAARAIAIQQVRILEEARKHIVTLLEELLGGASTWPRNADAINSKPFYKELWKLAAFVWVLASGSPTKSGAMLEWSMARDFLIKRFFKTTEARKALDSLIPRDPRDPDILMWSEKCTGVHTRAGALIFARRLHECYPLQVPEDMMWALRDAVSVANRTRALKILSSRNGGPVAVSVDGAASATGDSKNDGVVSASTTFADSRVVRFPIGWISPHSWKSMQARAFRFAMFVLRQAELDGKTNSGTVYLVSVRLMLRFMTDATTLTEGSFFSLLSGLPYNDPESREYIVIDFRDQSVMKLPVQMAVDRLMRISRGANWEPPNPNWSKSLIYSSTSTSSSADATRGPMQNQVVAPLIRKLPNPETISVVKVVACHEDIAVMNQTQ